MAISQGKQRLKRCVLRRLQKTDSDDADDMLRHSKGDRKGTVTDINRKQIDRNRCTCDSGLTRVKMKLMFNN